MSNPLDSIRGRCEGRPRGGVTLLADVAWLKREPAVIADWLCLRRATAVEVECFRDLFTYFHVRDSRNPYETRSSHTPEGTGTWMYFTPLPAEEFKYHVVEHVGANGPLYFLRSASVLAHREIHLGPGYDYGPNEQFGAHGELDLEYLRRDLVFDDANFVGYTGADLRDLAAVYWRFAAHDNSLINLERITADYLGLRRLWAHPNMRVLGMFALLESMLTHNPKPSDPYDSITRQITQKMQLLQPRFRSPLSYGDYFGQAKIDKAWKALYAVRSAIAHGGVLSFQNDQALAKSLDHTERFARLALRAVMRQALDEPRLIADLRDC